MGGTTTPEAGGVPAVRKLREHRDAILAGLVVAFDKMLVLEDASPTESVTFSVFLVARDATGGQIGINPVFDLTTDVAEQVKAMSETPAGIEIPAATDEVSAS